ncbi:MAG: hypothetical protein WCI72_00965 [archaeon]
MVEKFHYAPSKTLERRTEAIKTLERLWKPYSELAESFTSPHYNHERGEIARAISVIDDCHVRSLVESLDKAQKLLQEGKRDDAKEQVVCHYNDWRRKNLAHLYNACGDASFYGAGFWIARLVAPDKEVRDSRGSIKTAEQMLDEMGMPYQVVNI